MIAPAPAECFCPMTIISQNTELGARYMSVNLASVVKMSGSQAARKTCKSHYFIFHCASVLHRTVRRTEDIFFSALFFFSFRYDIYVHPAI